MNAWAELSLELNSELDSELDSAGRGVFSLEGMWCASCALAIEKFLLSQPGVKKAQVNFTWASVFLVWQPNKISLKTLAQRLAKLGYKLQPQLASNPQKNLAKHQRQLLISFVIAAFFSMWNMLAAWVVYLADLPPTTAYNLAFASVLLALPVVFYSGLNFYRLAWRGLKLKLINLDTFITLGVGASMLASGINLALGSSQVYADTATMLISLLLLGRLIEASAKKLSLEATSKLSSLAPETARLITPTGVKELPLKEIPINSLVEVQAGARLSIDGLVTQGTSQLDTAFLTGESQPVTVAPNQLVYAGSLNLTSPLIIQVLASYKTRRLDQLGLQMQQAFSSKQNLILLAEKLVAWLLPLSLAFALAGFIYYYFFLNLGLTTASLQSLSLLIAACPCALSLALPLVFSLASLQAAKTGNLWKDPASLESLAQAKTLALDKTGTLTLGKPQVTQLTTATGISHPEILQFIYLAEQGLAHPLAVALTNFARQELQLLNLPSNSLLKTSTHQIEAFSLGVKLTSPAAQVVIGSHAWLASLGVSHLPPVAANRVYVSLNNTFAAEIQLADPPRPQLLEQLTQLKQQFNLQLWLITGDSQAATDQLLSQLGPIFNKVITQASPEEKAQALQLAPAPAVFVGDGANDSLVLASAACGIALANSNSHNQLAQTAASVVITQGGLKQLLTNFTLAKKFYRLAKQNLVLAVIYNLGILVIFFKLGVSPLIAAIAMLASSFSLMANSLRLLKN